MNKAKLEKLLLVAKAKVAAYEVMLGKEDESSESSEVEGEKEKACMAAQNIKDKDEVLVEVFPGKAKGEVNAEEDDDDDMDLDFDDLEMDDEDEDVKASTNNLKSAAVANYKKVLKVASERLDKIAEYFESKGRKDLAAKVDEVADEIDEKEKTL